jgi:hypothetical protein
MNYPILLYSEMKGTPYGNRGPLGLLSAEDGFDPEMQQGDIEHLKGVKTLMVLNFHRPSHGVFIASYGRYLSGKRGRASAIKG